MLRACTGFMLVYYLPEYDELNNVVQKLVELKRLSLFGNKLEKYVLASTTLSMLRVLKAAEGLLISDRVLLVGAGGATGLGKSYS